MCGKLLLIIRRDGCNMPVNILLADDHRMVREGLKQLLEMDDNINVVSEADDGYECLNYANKTQPDIILLDINMPNLDGLQVLDIIKSQKMKCKVIILTIHNEIDYLIKALDKGCDGYILKDSDFDTLKKAIMTVYKGETYIEPSLVPLLNVRLAERDIMKDKTNELTRREIEVLRMIAAGSSNKEIASVLNISERTVKNHISNIFKKIDVSDTEFANELIAAYNEDFASDQRVFEHFTDLDNADGILFIRPRHLDSIKSEEIRRISGGEMLVIPKDGYEKTKAVLNKYSKEIDGCSEVTAKNYK